jgi:solute carrier family 25 thiamine pyrophosphate transporter 19
VTALWKGNVSAELLYLSYSSIQFLTYTSIPALLPARWPKEAKTFVSGSLAGAVATSTTYPFDLLRTRFAASAEDKVYSSLRYAVGSIYSAEGSRGFFRGLSPAIVQVVPYMGLFFLSYETIRSNLPRSVFPGSSSESTSSSEPKGAKAYLPLSTAALSGTLASVVAKTGIFPLDLLRKRLQVQGPTRTRYLHHNIPLHAGGIIATAKEIVLREGVRGLYRGLTISLVKAAPASAITMAVYESVLKKLKSKPKSA